MGSKSRKKIVFAIVEGPSDDEALGVILSRLYADDEVYVEIVHGDITADKLVSADNIASKIGGIVKKYAASTHYKASHFKQVIHLIDMDGAYIPDESIVRDSAWDSAYYSTTEIRIAETEKIIARNEKKRKNIDRICCMGTVWNTIPYRAYYMSANLDHVLYDKLNSTDEEKERDALAFAKKYKDNLEDFLAFICDSEFSVKGDFNESWKYIKKSIRLRGILTWGFPFMK